MKFREKPIEAFQYTGSDSIKNSKGEWLIPKWAITAFCYGILSFFYCNDGDYSPSELQLKDSKGNEEYVNFGDYIMQKHNGEIVAISEEDFLKYYERVSDDGK